MRIGLAAAGGKNPEVFSCSLLERVFDANMPAMRVYSKPCKFTASDGDECHGKAKAHGLCTGHLDQLDRGKPLTPLRGPHGRKHEGCTFPGCDKKHQGNGLCTGHASQQRRGQPLRPLGPWGRPPNPEGRWIDPKGYVFIKCPVENHPNAKSKKGWIAEHVWVMTQLLGRPLRAEESVHHRNLIRSDNRPSNLDRWFLAEYSDAPAWTILPGGPLSEHGAESEGYQAGTLE